MKVIPTIFATSKTEFEKRFNKLVIISKNIQIDFMDGKFVVSKSVSIKDIPNLKKISNNFEAHLMTLHPEKYLFSLKQKGFKKIIFHLESTDYPEKIIEKIKNLNLECWIALNPETNIKSIFPYLKKVNGILFLGVHPGKEHLSFIPEVYKKISYLREKDKKIKIQVDGGVNEKVAHKLAKLKVNAINSGSYVADSPAPKEAIRKLSKIR